MKQLDEQRYLWLLRAFIIFLIISIFLNLILFVSFGQISPTPKREVFFVSSQTENSQNLYITDVNSTNFLNISQDSMGYEVAKKYISNYIIDRESIFLSREKMQSLWGIGSDISFFSSRSVYEDFIKSSEYINGFINKEKEITTIQIKSIEYQNKMNLWDVTIDLQTLDSKGRLVKNTEKNIAIKASFLKKNLIKPEQAKWENPLGFQITEYKYK